MRYPQEMLIFKISEVQHPVPAWFGRRQILMNRDYATFLILFHDFFGNFSYYFRNIFITIFTVFTGSVKTTINAVSKPDVEFNIVLILWIMAIESLFQNSFYF